MFLDVLCHDVPLGPQESSGTYNREKIDLGWTLVMDMCCFVAVSIQNFLIGGNSSLTIGRVLFPQSEHQGD